MSLKLTHIKFLEKIKLLNSDLEILEEYKSAISPILIKNKYGVCKIISQNLYRSKPSILSAINKTEYFINQSKEVHENKYDYSKTNYLNVHKKVTITCPMHGDFEQTPGNHSQFGCEKCGRILSCGKGTYSLNMAERNKDIWYNIPCKIYNIRFWDNNEQFYKIGITIQEIDRRFSNISIYKYEIIEYLDSNLYDAIYLEYKIHKILEKDKYRPLKYFAGYKECFTLHGHTSQDVLERLKQL